MAAYIGWLMRLDGQRTLRRERVFRPRITVNDVPEHILERYNRLPKEAVLRLCDVVASTLRRPTKRSCALPVDVQVLVALGCILFGADHGNSPRALTTHL
ncbi:hypothetical protein ISCGN_003112 [Ixodes scapularis]